MSDANQPPSLSVVICSNNPRKELILETLNALKLQTLPYKEWELLVVDNASMPPLRDRVDLSWHPQSTIVQEAQLSMSIARIVGIRETRAPLLVFVDDDNRLAEDYLENVLKISRLHPLLGAWGGRVNLRFEKTPPRWTKPYLSELGLRSFDLDRMSNRPNDTWALPIGAGLCVRRSVAEHYASLQTSDPRRKIFLGRRAGQLGAEDYDLVFCASDLGLKYGLFTSLSLEHIMLSERVEEDYLLDICENNITSWNVLCSLREPQMSHKGSRLALLRNWIRGIMIFGKKRRFQKAIQLGKEKAKAIISKF